jgi:5-methylcytosine-specific restriction protein A
MEAIVEKSAARPMLQPPESAPIDLAREYVKNKVQVPALESRLSEQIKNKVKHSDMWLDRFQRVGDLLCYLRRFDISHNDPIYVEMKSHGLLTFEDIVDDLHERFELWAHDCSRISDFVIGERYSVYDILILARNYDTRAGGMFVLEANGKPTAVVIKATLSNGHYPNAWVREGESLKYYLKSISGNFGTHFKPNKAIIENPRLPVVTFTRGSETAPFIFRGLFHYSNILHEEGDAKAFILNRDDSLAPVMVEATYARDALEKNITQSMLRSQAERQQRLARASKRPKTYDVRNRVYSRNPDVIAEVLFQARGVCQGCNKEAPFTRSADGAPYLEVHHRIPLAMGGDDTVENAIALCPNCHRERHFGLLYSGKTIHAPAAYLDETEIDVAEAALQEVLNVQIS